jgi:predicted RNase H-like nuclease
MISPVSVDDWGRDLRELIARGQNDHGILEVLAVLQREVASLTLGMGAPPPVLHADRPVLGVDACLAGWVGVLLGADGRVTVHVAGSISALLAQVREGAEVAVVAIDIPIGLPDEGEREADRLVRAAVPGKESSVRGARSRRVYGSDPDYDVLGPKVLEVDAWIREGPGARVIEIEPELSFARLVGNPILVAKRTEEGVLLRREALSRVGLVPPPWYSGSGFAEHDLLDACAALWTAVRHLNGESESLPPEPEVFSDGLLSAIHV